MTNQEKILKVTLVRSKFGRKPGHRECIEGLGLRRIHQSVDVKATPSNMGMLTKVNYLLKIQEK